MPEMFGGSNHLLRLRYIIPAAAAFLGLHFLCTRATQPPFATFICLFLVAAPVLALAACFRCSFFCAKNMRIHWILVCAGLALWSLGMSLALWEQFFQHVSKDEYALASDFAYFLYGVPVLLAISLPGVENRLKLFLWVDGLQVVIAACLTYVLLFSVLPFTHQPVTPLPITNVARTYNIENLLLAVAATIRLLSCSPNTEERRFYRVLSTFLWTYAGCAGLFNYLTVQQITWPGAELLVDVPFLLLAILTLPLFENNDQVETSTPKNALATFIENGSPIFFSLAMLVLGAIILRKHFYIGMATLVSALVLYGARVITLQIRYTKSQDALQKARDRLEELSLEDSLTKIANRRCFDQVLEMEWNRATRLQKPLSLLLIDVDYFKNLNDRYGHRTGDECLVQIAEALKSTLPRNSDKLARYGGEEFAVILPDTPKQGAEAVAIRMQEAVRTLNIQNETPIGHFASISVGIATYEFPQAGSTATLMEASDRALYLAKQRGRNRIEYVPMHISPKTSFAT